MKFCMLHFEKSAFKISGAFDENNHSLNISHPKLFTMRFRTCSQVFLGLPCNQSFTLQGKVYNEGLEQTLILKEVPIVLHESYYAAIPLSFVKFKSNKCNHIKDLMNTNNLKIKI